jgi:hypothetical protein
LPPIEDELNKNEASRKEGHLKLYYPLQIFLGEPPQTQKGLQLQKEGQGI